MPYKELLVSVKIDHANPARAKDKEKMLKAFSDLGADDQARLTQIMQSPSALKALEENWEMLKSMFK